MKIILTGPSTRNNGHFVDAGNEVEVGGEPKMISSDRADALVDSKAGADEAELVLDTPA